MRIVGEPSTNLTQLQDRRVNYVGHGRLESAPETLSALHVISHELGHVNEFKNEAIREGADLQSIRVKINYELRDGRLVAVSGETQALSRKKKEDESLNPYSDGKKFQDLFQIQKTEKEEDTKKGKESEIASLDKIEKVRTKDLENKIRDLESKLESEKRAGSNPSNFKNETAEGKESFGTLTVDKSERAREIEQEKRRLEEEVRYLKVKEQLKETFSMLTDIRKSMISNVFGMIDFGNESKSGNVLDTFV